MLTCKKCGWTPQSESDLDHHHIVPKFLGGTDKDGRIYLCRENRGNDCHRKIHLFLKEVMKKETERWLKGEIDDPKAVTEQ